MEGRGEERDIKLYITADGSKVIQKNYTNMRTCEEHDVIGHTSNTKKKRK